MKQCTDLTTAKTMMSKELGKAGRKANDARRALEYLIVEASYGSPWAISIIKSMMENTKEYKANQ